MLFPQEPLTGKALIEATFQPEDVPDARLYRRLKTTAAGIERRQLLWLSRTFADGETGSTGAGQWDSRESTNNALLTVPVDLALDGRGSNLCTPRRAHDPQRACLRSTPRGACAGEAAARSRARTSGA